VGGEVECHWCGRHCLGVGDYQVGGLCECVESTECETLQGKNWHACCCQQICTPSMQAMIQQNLRKAAGE